MEQAAEKPRQKPGELWRNIQFSLAIYWRERKSMLFLCVLAVLMQVALPYAGILMPKVVLDLIEANAAPGYFVLVVGGIGLLLAALQYLRGYSNFITQHAIGTVGVFRALLMMHDKQMTMDYELMEDPDLRGMKDKADKAQQSNHTQAMNLPRTLVALVSNSLGFILYAVVIAAAVHPLMLVLLVVCAGVNWWALSRSRRAMEAAREDLGKADRKIDAVQNAMQDAAYAKDIRLYSAYEWLHGLAAFLRGEYRRTEGPVFARQLQAKLVDGATILLRDGLAYAYLIYLLLGDRLSLGDFVYVFGAVGALAGWISGILTSANDLGKASIEMSDMRAYMEYPDRMNTGPGLPLPQGDALPPGIAFSGVSYTYPKTEAPTLQDIDLTIAPGERIAIVGANGAGKTTFVKLLCGLYTPTQGAVRLGGQNAGAYNRDEYYTLFSTVFQDIHMMTCDIAGNVSQLPPEQTDLARVRRCLELSGLWEKVESLPQGMHTMLVREVNDDAATLSGGEKQKLAMARALYRDAPVIILDEPTAALDPIAENEVYEKYAELTVGKTSIFISHRLASTRFCDRILLIENGGITESGTHDALMALGGTYAHMFQVQASYYQKDQEGL